MRTALIGYSGFVGSNLMNQYRFSDLYNSTNVENMKSQEYDLIVCAGISAVKWLANKEPKKDYERIKVLENVLLTVKAKQFVLISTIDVYAVIEGENEDFDCSSVINHAYGTHRLEFESFCSNKFDNCIILRFPSLFGDGLKKNIIYDLLNDNCLQMINAKSSYQYYHLKYLWRDIKIALDNNIKLVNIFTEPLTTQEIFNAFFSEKDIGKEAVAAVHYNLHTKYAEIWGNNSHYMYSKDAILQQLSEFIEAYRKQDDQS